MKRFLLLALLHALHLVQCDVPYIWPNRQRYYYDSLQEKMAEVILGRCPFELLPAVNHTSEASYAVPMDAKVYVFPAPVAGQLKEWYLAQNKPKQMRVDPLLCDIIPSFKRPIFNNTGCQLKHYMSYYAPRCQVGYLKSVCALARQEISNASASGFVLPEADHSLWAHRLPPEPYLLAVRNAFVTQCGQASMPCGKSLSVCACGCVRSCVPLSSARCSAVVNSVVALFFPLHWWWWAACTHATIDRRTLFFASGRGFESSVELGIPQITNRLSPLFSTHNVMSWKLCLPSLCLSRYDPPQHELPYDWIQVPDTAVQQEMHRRACEQGKHSLTTPVPCRL